MADSKKPIKAACKLFPRISIKIRMVARPISRTRAKKINNKPKNTI
jgi:hypothetical protein